MGAALPDGPTLTMPVQRPVRPDPGLLCTAHCCAAQALPTAPLFHTPAPTAGFRLPGEYQAPALGRVRRPGSDVIEEVPASQEEAEVAAYLEGLEEEEAQA